MALRRVNTKPVLWWMVFGVETGMEVGRRGQVRIGFVEEQCFEFGVKELWRDSKE